MLRSKPRLARRGLSTLEMVLALPILLMIMAVMINFGTVASWKLRGLSVSRHAVFSTRAGRSGDSDPRAPYWPVQPQNISHSGAGDIPALDHPTIDHPVVRGPLPNITVRRELLDPSRGLRVGSSSLTRSFPLLKSLGPYELQSRTYLLDDRWQYWQMGMGSNSHRRTAIIYVYPDEPPEDDDHNYKRQYETEMVALYHEYTNQNRHRPYLVPLLHTHSDREVSAYLGLAAAGRGSIANGFVPPVASFCTLDEEVANEAVDQLIERIDRAAESMVRGYISFYRSVIAGVNAQDPPLPNGPQIIAIMEQKIQQLEQDLQALGG